MMQEEVKMVLEFLTCAAGWNEQAVSIYKMTPERLAMYFLIKPKKA